MPPAVSANPSFKVIDGFQVPALSSEENFRSGIRYKPRPDDIFIATYPKCGTTWMQHILALILRKGQPMTSMMEMQAMTPYLEITGVKSVEEMMRPGVIKTHLPFHLTPWSEEAKYIYVTRNPKDCCVSYFHHMRNVPFHFFNGTFDQFFEHFISGQTDYGDYFDNLMSWYPHRNDPNVLFVTYEELKEDIDSAILKLASFIDDEKYAEPIRRDPQVMSNIKEYSSFKGMKEFMAKGMAEMFSMSEEDLKKSHFPDPLKDFMIEMMKNPQAAEMLKSDEPNVTQFIRKGVVGDWKNYFSEDQNRRLEEKYAERTKGTDIPEFWKKYM